MKNALCKLFILVLLSVTFFVPAAYAKGDQPVNVQLAKNEIVQKDYFAAGDTVTLSGVVNGDAYIAGGNVLVEGTVNGDLLVVGGMVTISGTVKNDVRAASGTFRLSGKVGGNMTLAGGNANVDPQAAIGGSLLAGTGNLELFGPVGKGLTAGVGNLIVNSSIGGDVLAGVGQLTMQPRTKIAGDVTYWSEEPAVIQDNATLSGELVYNEMPKTEAPQVNIAKGGMKALSAAFAGMAVAMALVGVIALFVLGLIIMALLPSFTDRTVRGMQKNPWGSFGLGIVTIIVLPTLAVVAMMTVIGIPIGMFLFMALSLLCVVGHIYAALFIGHGVFTAFKADVHHAWHLLVGLLVLGVFTLIPVLGWLARGIFVLIGTGAVLFEKHATYHQMRAKHLV